MRNLLLRQTFVKCQPESTHLVIYAWYTTSKKNKIGYSDLS
jgi:hypothetical protein